MDWLKRKGIFLERFSEEELYQIYVEAAPEWPTLLGEKPEGFDSLPFVRPTEWLSGTWFAERFSDRSKRYKSDYLVPIRSMIVSLLGADKLMDFIKKRKPLEERILEDLIDANPGERIEILQELAGHLAKQLDS